MSRLLSKQAARSVSYLPPGAGIVGLTVLSALRGRSQFRCGRRRSGVGGVPSPPPAGASITLPGRSSSGAGVVDSMTGAATGVGGCGSGNESSAVSRASVTASACCGCASSGSATCTSPLAGSSSAGTGASNGLIDVGFRSLIGIWRRVRFRPWGFGRVRLGRGVRCRGFGSILTGARCWDVVRWGARRSRWSGH